MTQQAAETAEALPFEAIPIVDLPNNYHLGMPTFLARMAAVHGPIFRSRVSPDRTVDFGSWTIHLVGPDANRLVLHSHRKDFSHEGGWSPHISPAFEQGLLNSDDPEHEVFRRITNPAFTMSYMNRYFPIVQRIVARHAEDWVERGMVDLYAEAREIALDAAAETLLGLTTQSDLSMLRDSFYALLHPEERLHDVADPERIVGLVRSRYRLDSIVLRCIAERRRTPRDDVLGMLVRATDEHGNAFTEKQLLGQIHILLAAGHETTTTLVSRLLGYLAEHRDFLARVTEEIDQAIASSDGDITLKTVRSSRLLGYAVDEAGRLSSPAASLPRRVRHDLTAFGFHIPAGSYVELAVAAGHRLPWIFADPERFDPDRFAAPRVEDKRAPHALATFGGGPRVCQGINFAQIEIKVMATYVLSRYVLLPVPDRPFEHAYFSPVASVRGGIWAEVARRPAADTPRSEVRP